MEFKSAAASKNLSQYVKNYWTIESSAQGAQQLVQRVVPDGFASLMFYSEPVDVVSGTGRHIGAPVILSGQHGHFYDIAVPGHFTVFAITFRPLFLIFRLANCKTKIFRCTTCSKTRAAGSDSNCTKRYRLKQR